MRDIRPIPAVEAVKTKLQLSCDTSVKIQQVNMWKRSHRARPPSKFQQVKMWKRSFLVRPPSKFGKLKMWKPSLNWQFHGRADPRMIRPERSNREHVLHPSARQASPHIIRDTFCSAKHNMSCVRCLSKTHLVRGVLQIPTAVADVKMKLACETSFRFYFLTFLDFDTP